MRGTSSERLGAAFNLEVQSRRHCILHSGLSEKRPPTSFAVYHFSMTLKLAICCAIPNWCGKETTALILSFFCLSFSKISAFKQTLRDSRTQLSSELLLPLWGQPPWLVGRTVFKAEFRVDFVIVLLPLCCYVNEHTAQCKTSDLRHETHASRVSVT